MRVLNPIQAAARLDDWEASGMLSLGTPRTFGQGEVLLRQGPGSTSAALITRGLVRVAAGDVSLAILGDGDLIGEEPAILSGPPIAGNRVTVTVALTRVRARVFPVADLRRFLAENPIAMRAAAQGQCARRLDAEIRMESAAHDKANRRLAKFLCDLEPYGSVRGKPDKPVTVIQVGFTRSDLAAWIGCCPETIGRTLRAWGKRGIAYVTPGSVSILDRETLARIAGIDRGTRLPVRPGWNRMADRQAAIDTLRSGSRLAS